MAGPAQAWRLGSLCSRSPLRSVASPKASRHSVYLLPASQLRAAALSVYFVVPANSKLVRNYEL